MFLPPTGADRVAVGGNPSAFSAKRRTSKRSLHKCALLDFGGLGAAPPVIRADGAVASPRRNTPLKKRPGKARTFPFDGCARSAFFCDTGSVIDRGGVFRLWRSVLSLRFKRNHFCDSVFSGFKAISKSTGKAKCWANHVGVRSARFRPLNEDSKRDKTLYCSRCRSPFYV